jgi:MFS family permease
LHDAAGRPSPARAAFRHRAFTVIWIATVVSNIGTRMYSAASGWLMVSLDSEALLVSLVQVATSLPMFLFALAAGALADIFDKRRFLIGVEAATTLLSGVFAALVQFGHVSPGSLLLFSHRLLESAPLGRHLLGVDPDRDRNGNRNGR